MFLCAADATQPKPALIRFPHLIDAMAPWAVHYRKPEKRSTPRNISSLCGQICQQRHLAALVHPLISYSAIAHRSGL
ncbi:hypothetical protein BaRGS_00022636 [Batillaria attramentaria]|uniref:Uncharacterized protein n=1 Tax=Batillaria attramentaria TaxID=370345 RepID=A0ABD0KGP9_9CAEN